MSQDMILKRLSALDTNTVSDALDFLSLKGAAYGLRPLWDCPKIVGRASTVKLGLKPDAVATVHPLDETTMDHDRILVISGGIDGVSCAGDFIDNVSKARRIRGTIIDGMGQDMAGSKTPVYGRGVAMISACNQVVQVGSGTPVQMRGITVHQDDYVIADDSGTLFVPAKRIEQVLEVGELIDRRRALVAEAVRAGRPVSDLRNETQLEAICEDTQSLTAAASSNRNPNKAGAEDGELVSLFAHLDTPGVSDALDKLGIAGQVPDIMPLTNYNKVTVGPAFTVRYVPASDPPGSVGDFIDDAAMGDVVVVDNGGRTDCTVWGDIMTQYAGLRGIAGSVIYGVCRDVNRAMADDFPLFTVGRYMRTGKDRVQVGGINESVGIGGVRVHPRDIVVADANGVIIVPRVRAREVAEVARRIEKSEHDIREMIAGGATLAEARAAVSYHQLQRRSFK